MQAHFMAASGTNIASNNTALVNMEQRLICIITPML